MADTVYKKIEVVGTSSMNLEDAIQNAVAKSSETVRNMSWLEVSEIRGRILAQARGRDGPGYAAVVGFETPAPPGPWLFDAGLARGALGARAVFAQLGDRRTPAELTGIEVIRLNPDDPASLDALSNRLTG